MNHVGPGELRADLAERVLSFIGRSGAVLTVVGLGGDSQPCVAAGQVARDALALEVGNAQQILRARIAAPRQDLQVLHLAHKVMLLELAHGAFERHRIG